MSCFLFINCSYQSETYSSSIKVGSLIFLGECEGFQDKVCFDVNRQSHDIITSCLKFSGVISIPDT